METVRVERSGGVVTVTLDRPAKKNAANPQMFDELEAVFAEIASNRDDRAVVITGAGDAFCSGADLTEFGGGMAPLVWMRRVGRVCLALHHLPQPSIAKVNGVAAGAGANLALGCDLVVASAHGRFCEIFARRGLAIDFGGSWVLPRLVGLHQAKELALLADMVTAEQAFQVGIVNRVVAADQLDEFVDGWAARLAAGPTLALSMTKRLLNSSASLSLAEAIEAEAMAQTVCMSTADAAEALQAFLEKRDPRFEGR